MFTETPRWFGFPLQHYIRSKASLLNILETVNGTNPCFISVLVFPEPSKYIFDRLVFDLDSKRGLKEPYKDASKLKDFCTKLNLPCTIIFSGRKGFHFYIHLKPSSVSPVRLEAAHEGLTENLDLKTADRHLFGDLRRVMRMPTTVYIDSEGKKNGRYCRYLTDEDFDKGIMSIKKISKEPGIFPEKPEVNMLFSEFVEHIDNYWKYVFTAENGNGTMEFDVDRDKENIRTFYAIAPLCLRKHIGDTNPKHIIRFETSCWLKLVGYNNISIYDFYEKQHWNDWNRQITRYQVRRGKVRPPKCNRIRSIIGDKYCNDCPLGVACVIN